MMGLLRTTKLTLALGTVAGLALFALVGGLSLRGGATHAQGIDVQRRGDYALLDVPRGGDLELCIYVGEGDGDPCDLAEGKRDPVNLVFYGITLDDVLETLQTARPPWGTYLYNNCSMHAYGGPPDSTDYVECSAQGYIGWIADQYHVRLFVPVTAPGWIIGAAHHEIADPFHEPDDWEGAEQIVAAAFENNDRYSVAENDLDLRNFSRCDANGCYWRGIPNAGFATLISRKGALPTPAPSPTQPPGGETREAMIQRLYRETFCRDADPGGLQSYLNSGFNEEQVRASLQSSPEGQRIDMIRRIFREELGRDPLGSDCGGLRAYYDSGLNEQQIRESIRNSDEWRRLHGGVTPIPPTPGSTDDKLKCGGRTWNVVVREHDTQDLTPDWRNEQSVGCKGYDSGREDNLSNARLSNGAGANDILSSVAVAPGHSVVLCVDSERRGGCRTFSGVTDFVGWDFDNRASSLYVDGAQPGGGDPGVNHDCGAGGEAFYMWEWGNRVGRCLRLRDGSDGYYPNLGAIGLNDVFGRDFATDGYQAYACEHADFQGQCWWILRGGQIGGMEAKISSIQVFKKHGDDNHQCDGFAVLYANEKEALARIAQIELRLEYLTGPAMEAIV